MESVVQLLAFRFNLPGVVKYEPSLYFLQLCDSCKSACVSFPSLLSKLFPRSSPNPNACTHEKSKSARALIRESQRFRNKADGLYLTTPNLPFVCFLSVFLHHVLAIKNNLPVYLMIPCNYGTNPEPVAQIMKYKVSRALHAVTNYYTCIKLLCPMYYTFAVCMCV